VVGRMVSTTLAMDVLSSKRVQTVMRAQKRDDLLVIAMRKNLRTEHKILVRGRP